MDVSDDAWFTELAGTTLIKYGELTEEQKSNEKLVSGLKTLARLLVLEDLSEKAGIQLVRVCPFSYDWPWMFELFNNYNVEERTYEMEEVSGSVQNVVNVVQEAMAVGDHKPELLWWYDWEHLQVVRATPLCDCILRALTPSRFTGFEHSLVRAWRTSPPASAFMRQLSHLVPSTVPLLGHPLYPRTVLVWSCLLVVTHVLLPWDTLSRSYHAVSYPLSLRRRARTVPVVRALLSTCLVVVVHHLLPA